MAKQVLSYSPGVRGDPINTSLDASTPSSKRQLDPRTILKTSPQEWFHPTIP